MAEQSILELRLDDASQKLLDLLIARVRPRALFEAMHRALTRIAQIVAGRVVKSQLSGTNVRRRTGGLARSIVGRAERVHNVPALRIGIFKGPALRYAGVIEHGTKGKNPASPFATIVPKKAKALAVPGEKALTKAGVDRFGGPRKYPGKLRFLPIFRGRVVGKLVDDKEARGLEKRGLSPFDAMTAYLLLKKMDIEPRYYLRTGVREQLPAIAKILVDALVKELSPTTRS